MLHFLKQTRKFVNSAEPICIVLGNESCDLDSAVCAITLAYHYHQQQQCEQTNINSTAGQQQNYLPVLNIPRCDYPLKTEVKYVLEQHEIQEAYLTFRDELREEFLARSKYILVDHHVSPFAAQCLQVFDHRVVDVKAQLTKDCQKHIELVGSCATLIAEQMLKKLITAQAEALAIYKPILQMLRNTIVLDTVNFSAEANRATPKDIAVCAKLEEWLRKLLAVPKERAQLFDELVAARADISSLTASQLLRKDLKILTNASDVSVTIALPGFPMLVQQFVQMQDAAAAVQEFAKQINASIVILMGMLVTEGKVQRDLGFIDVRGASELCEQIRQKLLVSTEPALDLVEYENIDFLKGHFYKMNNVNVTRKHILPVAKQLLDQWKS